MELGVSFLNWTLEAVETNSKEVKARNIPTDIVFHISAQIEIPDMEN